MEENGQTGENERNVTLKSKRDNRAKDREKQSKQNRKETGRRVGVNDAGLFHVGSEPGFGQNTHLLRVCRRSSLSCVISVPWLSIGFDDVTLSITKSAAMAAVATLIAVVGLIALY